MSAFEYRDDSQIFHTLPATDEEFWGERKETPRFLKAVKGLGRTAARATGITGNLLVAAPLRIGQKVAKGNEVFWRSVDALASHTGMAEENPIRQHALKSTVAAGKIADTLRRTSSAALGNATDLMDDSYNKYWQGRYATMAQEELTAAKEAHDAGDLRSAQKHMAEARINKYLHNGR